MYNKKLSKKYVVIFLSIIMTLNIFGCGSMKNAVETNTDDNPQGIYEDAESEAEGTTDSSNNGEIEAQSKAQESALGQSTLTDAEASKVEEILNQMTLRQKIEQMMFVCFRKWNNVDAEYDDLNKTIENKEDKTVDCNVIALNDEIRKAFSEHNFGGTILFGQNYVDAEQTLELICDIQKNSVKDGALPLFVATDQEGGYITRLSFGNSGIGNMALAATKDPENARIMGGIYGSELSLLGVNMDFAPVVDVNNNPANPVIGVRSFSDDPDIVSEYGTAYMKGLSDSGTIATLKHFPGHGNTDTDSHTSFPLNNSTLEELKKCELIPFQKLIDSGAEVIMTAHIQYPQIETNTYKSITTGEMVYLPATLSHTILTDLLRNDMGFEGIVVTDSLVMDAIEDNFAMEDVVKMAINAGANMLILPFVTDRDAYERDLKLIDTAIEFAENGEIDMEMVNDSVRRILLLKEKYGILDKKDFEISDDLSQKVVNGIGGNNHKEEINSITLKSLTLLKNENEAFPIKLSENDKTLILFADNCASRIGSADMAKAYLTESGIISKDADISVMANDRNNENECIKKAQESDHIILINRTYNASCFDPKTDDGFSSAVFDKIIADSHTQGKKVILISCQLPYDAARFPDADAIILTYGSSTMKTIPAQSGKDSAYMPNLPVAIEAAFGPLEPSGILPVNIPKLSEDYKFTQDILYNRGAK